MYLLSIFITPYYYTVERPKSLYVKTTKLTKKYKHLCGLQGIFRGKRCQRPATFQIRKFCMKSIVILVRNNHRWISKSHFAISSPHAIGIPSCSGSSCVHFCFKSTLAKTMRRDSGQLF